MTRRERRRLRTLRLLLIAVVAGAIAIVVSTFASAFFPVGLARPIEPDRGIDVDRLVVLGGAVVFVAAAMAVASATSMLRRTRSTARHEPGAVTRAVATAPLPVSMTTGMRIALQSPTAPGNGAMRSTIVAATVGVAAVVASLSFAHSLDSFVSTPARFGWDFDAVVYPVTTAPHNDVMTFAVNLHRMLSPDAGVLGFTGFPVQQVRIGGSVVPGVAIGQNAGTAPSATLLEGRLPVAQDEVALGRLTLRDLGRAVGDEIELGDPPHPYRIVGAVVLPTLTAGASVDHAALGSGALFVVAGLEGATRVDLSLEQDGFLPPVAIDLADGGDDAIAALQGHLDDQLGPDVMEVRSPFLSGDTAGYAGVRSTPVALAAILAALAAITVGHTLVLAVRTRRRDFAVMRSLGMTQRQVLAIVLWNAATIAIIASLVAIPLGALLGRLAWVGVTDRLGIAEATEVSVSTLTLALPVALAVACVVAVIPAVVGLGHRPAAVLRTE